MRQSFGVLGYPLSHTLSPMLHGMIYRELEMDAVYNVFEVPAESVEHVVDSARTLGIRGINVTIPYKQTILPQLDSLSPEAEILGAVNTVHILPDGTAKGYNTDYFGFLMQLEHYGIEIPGRRFVLLGMSGAGRAVYRALLDQGAAEVTVVSTDPAKGIPYSSLPGLTGYDTIVNCTPVGMYPKVNDCIVDVDVLRHYSAAVDVIYNPLETEFMRRARSCGVKKICGGLYMLAAQGVRSFEIWTGQKLESETIDAVFRGLQAHFR